MKRSELEEIITEELYKNIIERIVSSRNPPRKMTPPQVTKRDAIGKKLKNKPDVVKKFKSKYGEDWEYWIWATATNKAIDGE